MKYAFMFVCMRVPFFILACVYVDMYTRLCMRVDMHASLHTWMHEFTLVYLSRYP